MKDQSTLWDIEPYTFLPKEPKDFNLFLFREISYSDAYDGKSAVLDGAKRTIVFYGPRIACARYKLYERGAGAGTQEVGDEKCWDMYMVAELFLKILRIARAKFFESHRSERDEALRASRTDWDHFLDPGQNILDILISHPQYQALDVTFGVKLKKVSCGGGQYRKVLVTKRYNGS